MSDAVVSGILKAAADESPTQIITDEVAAQEATQEVVEGAEGQEAAAPAEGEEAANQEKKADEPKPEDAVKAEEDKKFAQKFAALSKREKAVAKREKDIQKRLADLEAKLKASEAPKVEEKEALDLRIKKDPFNTLKELGFDFDSLTKIALNEGKLTPEMQLKLQQEQMEAKLNAKIAQLEKQREEEKRQQQEEQQKAQEKAYKQGIGAHIKANLDKYELLDAEGEYGINTVFDVIKGHYDETEEVMDLDEAASKVEDYLLEEAKKRLGLGKLKKLLGDSAAQVDNKPATEQKAPEKKQSVTLSNANAQSSGGRKIIAQSREEALEEAAKLIRFTE
jgi:hypothetical protein